jgi:hypothetical protein
VGATATPDLTGSGSSAGSTFVAGFDAAVTAGNLPTQISGPLNAIDLTGSGTGAGATFTAGFGTAANGASLVSKISAQMAAGVAVFDGAGRAAGTKWGSGFTAVVESGVGPYLVAMLVKLVTPGVMAQLAAQSSTEGAQ